MRTYRLHLLLWIFALQVHTPVTLWQTYGLMEAPMSQSHPREYMKVEIKLKIRLLLCSKVYDTTDLFYSIILWLLITNFKRFLLP